MMFKLDLPRIFNKNRHVLIGSPFYFCDFTINKQKKFTEIKGFQNFTNNILKTNCYIDPQILKDVKGSKKVTYIVQPISEFFYKTKLETKKENKVFLSSEDSLRNAST